MKNKQALSDKLNTSLLALDGLVQQLRETQDYSEKSEMIFFLKELVLEQMDGKLQENENINHSNNQTR